ARGEGDERDGHRPQELPHGRHRRKRRVPRAADGRPGGLHAHRRGQPRRRLHQGDRRAGGMRMTARLATLVAHDARLQYRYGIYAAYAFVVALYAMVLVWGAQWLPAWVPAVIIFTDPAALGFFFLGALMMLEKAESVRTALAVAPISAADYFLGKTITLTSVSLIACAVLLVFIHRPADPALLMLTVALTAVQYIGIGVPIALRFRTVNAYLVGSGGFLTPVIAPGFLALLPDMPLWLTI